MARKGLLLIALAYALSLAAAIALSLQHRPAPLAPSAPHVPPAPGHDRPPIAPGTGIAFNRDVRPILADKCFACHGPDKGKRKAGLRLDLESSALAERGDSAAIVP